MLGQNNYKNILFFLILLISKNQFAGTLELADYLQEVKASNPVIQASTLRALALKHRISPAKTLDDPFIAAGLDEIPFEGGKGKIWRYQVSQSFPFPGKLKAKGRIAEETAHIAEADTETLSRQMQVMATQSFLKAVYNLKAIELNERIRKIIEETTASAKARYRTGDSSHHEWLLAKLELSILNIETLRLKRTQTSLYSLLNELRNLPPDTEIKLNLDQDKLDQFISSSMKEDIENQPEVKSWKFQTKAAASELKLVKLSYAPDFVIQGMAMEPRTKEAGMMEPSNWGVMVGITVPIFFWRKQSELVAAAENERLSNLAGQRSLMNRLKTELTDAKLQLQSSLEVVALYQNDVIPLTEIAVKNARTSYTAKTMDLGQLLVALRSQRSQELELLGARMDVLIAKTRLNNLLSNPPVQKFAPARPTLFGSSMGQMSDSGMDSPATINMGQGMSGPAGNKNPIDASGPAPDGMRGM